MDTIQTIFDPSRTVVITSLLMVAVDIIKHQTGLNGQVNRVRWLAFVFGIMFSLCDAFFSSLTIPTPSFYLLYQATVRGLLVTGAAYGVNALRTPSGIVNPDPANPLAPVQDAVSDAAKAANRVTDAIANAQDDLSAAAATLPAPEPVATAPALPPALPAPPAANSGAAPATDPYAIQPADNGTIPK